MTDNDLRGAALAALFALETLEADAPADVWHYSGIVSRLKHALGRRESAPEDRLTFADMEEIVAEHRAVRSRAPDAVVEWSDLIDPPSP